MPRRRLGARVNGPYFDTPSGKYKLRVFSGELDKGRDLDWFQSPFINTLAVISFIAVVLLVATPIAVLFGALVGARVARLKSVAAEQQRDRAIEERRAELIAWLGHDLRTPLTSIKASVTTLIGEESSDDPVKLDHESRFELLEIINEEADRLNRFVENMVDLAKLEAGELRLRRRWGSVEEIIATARERASALTAKHHVEVFVETELPSVRVDATLLAEVLYSLIDNAAKYSPGGSTIKITARRAKDEMISISVEDQGRGVPVELRQRIFDKFFRATSDNANQPSGLGMGLAIARGILEAHGGHIWIESGANDHGTLVQLLIPIGDEDAVEGTDKYE